MLKNRHWLIVIALILAGVLLITAGILIRADDGEAELFQKYREAAIFYEENPSSSDEAEQRFIDISLATGDKNLKAAAFYSSGAIWLEEFWQKKEISSLKKAIVYLQESLRVNPELAIAKRNLERALREVKDENLAKELGLPSDEDAQNGSDGQKADNGTGQSKESETQESGSAPTDEPLPYSDEEGYGRGRDYDDY